MTYLLDGQESQRLQFRKIINSDYDKWLEFFRTPKTSEHWIYEKSTPEIECENWYQNQFRKYMKNEGGMNALIDKESNELVGHCGLQVLRVDDILEVEIGYSLLPTFWNKGYAAEAAKKCRDYAFENNLSKSLISIISLTNIASQKVAVNIGMTIDKTTLFEANKVNIFRVYSPKLFD